MKNNNKNFVFLKIPKDEWNNIEKTAKNEGRASKIISYNDLSRYRILYENDIYNKQKSAKEAHKIKKAIRDMKIYYALENIFSGLFKEDIELTYNKLASQAGVNYRTARRFWKEYNLDKWIPLFKIKNEKALRDFLINELAESMVYAKHKRL